MTAGRREQLATALFRVDVAGGYGLGGMSYEAVADALLPTVDDMIRQAQAEALEDAASDLVNIGAVRVERVATWLRVRAAAVTTDQPGSTQNSTADRPQSPASGPGSP